MTLTLQSLISSQTDIFENSRVKLVRHGDHRPHYREMLKHRSQLLKYQSEQVRPVFDDCDYIISFLGGERSRSTLFGIFKVGNYVIKDGRYCYDLKEVDILQDLLDRVVIDWGGGERTWIQGIHKIKKIIEILPKGYIGSFPGLMNFALQYSDFQRLLRSPDANQDWYHHLSSVKGIYLILDTRSGQQYIGSAYGERGIWQRWFTYSLNGHGDNSKLKDLAKVDPDCFQYFLFSILQPLPSSSSKNEVLEIEHLYMRKLGSRAHGLN